MIATASFTGAMLLARLAKYRASFHTNVGFRSTILRDVLSAGRHELGLVQYEVFIKKNPKCAGV